MMVQHYISIEPIYRVIRVVAFLATGEKKCHPHSNVLSYQTRDNHTMIFQWRANRANRVNDTCMFVWHAAAKYTAAPVLEWCWASVVDNLKALNQQWAR